ncbi:hypothetical protein ACCQ08_03035, partial [Comamonas sp. SY3]
MAENNSSDPLKTAGEPFVALGECMADQICQRVAELPDRDSPADWPEAMLVTPDELRNIILDAINDAAQAVEAQAAPAAVAVTDAQIDAILDEPAGMIFYVSDQRHKQHLFARRVLALAAPALPATEDSSAGDLAQVRDVRMGFENWASRKYPNLNLTRIEDAYCASLTVGLWEAWQASAALPTPHSQAEVQAEPVIYVSRGQLETHTDPDSDGGRYLPARRTPLGLLNYPLYSAPQAQPADALTRAALDVL